jgi:signal transduction histidine kinase
VIAFRRAEEAVSSEEEREMATQNNGRKVDRAVWVLFFGAWIAYAALMVSSALMEGHSAESGLVHIVAPMILATVVALRRRSLLNPEWSLARTVGIHVGVGIGYAVLSGVGTTLLLYALDLQDDMGFTGDPRVLPLLLSFYYGLIYTILAGFLMWTESLRRVQETQALLAREAVLRAEAEAKVVRAQFNPHFVFNTLHSLMLLVRADPGTAERAIEDVAALIRYASVLERRDLDAVPLGQELEIARRYLGLESLRLSERMRVSWEIDPGLETVAVPPFSLQVLLENAIKHGIAPKEDGGRIRIRIREEEGVLVVEVEDDGMGASPDAVRAAEGKGLSLLERRVVTLFGDRASLTWRTAPGKGFSVLLRVPVSRLPTPTLNLALSSPGEPDR